LSDSNFDFVAPVNSNESARTTGSDNYFELKLDAPLGDEFDSNFYIDEELETDEYSLVLGTYPLDASIGEFGGYRIPVRTL